MRKALLFIALLSSIGVAGQEIEDKDFNSFYKDIVSGSNGIVIVNFWATWCKPCIEELPVFERINSESDSLSLKVVLLNLDFNSKYKNSVSEFLQKRKLLSRVIHLNDTDPNKWIDKVDKQWSGAIPSTVIFKDGNKIYFKEGQVTYEELNAEIKKVIKK